MDDQAEYVQPPENYQSPIDGTILTTLVSSMYSTLYSNNTYSEQDPRGIAEKCLLGHSTCPKLLATYFIRAMRKVHANNPQSS